MHYNFFLLRALCPILANTLRGFTLVSCFSQNKDELVLEFNDARTSFFIRALLDPAFTCITFPNSFHRARKNSIDLFNDALMQRVESIEVIPHERSFLIQLTGDYVLLFKLHGNRANLLLLHQGIVVDLFKQQLEADRSITVVSLQRTLDWSEPNFHQHLEALPQYYNVLGKLGWSYLKAHGFDRADENGKWELFKACHAQLENPRFFLVQWQGQIVFSLLPIGTIIREFADPITALNEFAAIYLSDAAFARAKNRLISDLQAQQTKLGAQVQVINDRLAVLAHDRHFQQWADIIMANLHRLEPGAAELVAENFYAENELIHMPLKKEWSAQKNAETYYRKSKNQAIEVQQLQTSLTARTAALEAVSSKLTAVAAAQQLKELEPFLTTATPLAEKKTLPFHEHEFLGFQILVGKHAAGNDTLLREYAHKNDLWLHAKDAPGSHVIIKHRSGHVYPKALIETAASWAAYFSKRKTEGLVPVAYTPCKYVRKRKGDPPGAVVVEREETVLVPPLAP